MLDIIFQLKKRILLGSIKDKEENQILKWEIWATSR